MKKFLIAALMCACVLGMTSTAKAVVLAPGGVAAITNSAPALLGTHVIVGYNQSVVYDSITASITQDVYLNSTGYLFLYRITRSGEPTTNNSVHRFTTTDFTGFATDADAYQSVVGDDLPHFMDRSGTGNTIGFSFENLSSGDLGLAPNTNSAILWIQTNTQYLTMGTGNFINGGVKAVPLYAPGVVPEPATLSLLGLGILGLFGFRRRKV
ncbi:MAG: PEP-CTERM sorting domain-containing protein [Candidatus Omnitrophica bacterium]|nr:PEP-CTERM sorting domain-containing protein [Candidatus Omnitrophota bacterium]